MFNPQESYHEQFEINLVSPLWLKFDQKNRRFFGTPTKSDIRNYRIQVLYRYFAACWHGPTRIPAITRAGDITRFLCATPVFRFDNCEPLMTVCLYSSSTL